VNRFVGNTGDHSTGVSGEGVDSEYRQLPFAVNDSLSFLITFQQQLYHSVLDCFCKIF
jgi:hypothetical protein